ncbi:MAG: NADP(H)-dependent aldo-keto reductase [Vampirovibrionales bacterium]|nr:NADP(H)-dependent aldo-keto reductase [Vampirovibrionales bacterium]
MAALCDVNTMPMRALGQTGLNVSLICLGTMTWGQQNTEAEAHAQLDWAVDNGVNFIDTAELYAVPPRAETYGKTEAYLGTWLKKAKNRERVIVATKVAGPSPRLVWIRDGDQRLDADNISAACEASLKRLQIETIDLYQTHWPDRNANCFGELGFKHRPDETLTPPEATLEALQALIQAGKVRHVGVSNETPWGLMQHLKLAEQKNLPRIASTQNPYSLLNRSFEVGLAEVALREQVGLLAYSPLAFGQLAGKYLPTAKTPATADARLNQFGGHFSRYSSPHALAAVQKYVALAEAHGLNLAQMALAYVNQQPFVTSTIIGATTMAQLQENVLSVNVQLSPEVLAGIEAIHDEYTYPCP